MPLSLARGGETYIIRKISGKDALSQRLEEMGCVVDHPITVISVNSGNVIVLVKGSRLGLDRSMANRIHI